MENTEIVSSELTPEEGELYEIVKHEVNDAFWKAVGKADKSIEPPKTYAVSLAATAESLGVMLAVLKAGGAEGAMQKVVDRFADDIKKSFSYYTAMLHSAKEKGQSDGQKPEPAEQTTDS